MAWDISWLWNALNAIGTAITSWFSGVWDTVSQIANTGQGIFQGLVAFATALWDAILKGVQTLGEWLYNAFKWFYEGLVGLAQTLGSWISTAYQWLASGIQWIGSQIYNFGQWLWNGILWVWDVIRNTLIGLWNWITSTISGIATAIGNWWSNVINGVNAWFTNLLKIFRQKIVTTIMADVAISGMWKAGERILNPTQLKDIGYGLLGIGLSPLIGYAIGKFVDAIVPIPSTEPYPLIPSISGLEYTPSSLEIARPTEPTPPTAPPTPPAYGYTPVRETSLGIDKPSYQVRWDAGIDKPLPIAAPTYEREILYEYYNTGDDLASTINHIYMIAQTFTPHVQHYVSRLRLKLGKLGNPEKLKVSIKATSDGHPYGDDIVTVEVDGGLIPSVQNWVSIDIPPTLLNAETKYAIVLKGIGVDADNFFFWMKDSTSPTYADGNEEVSTDGGATWSSVDHDQMFEVYGY